MGIIGKIIGSSTGTNKDSGGNVLLLEVELSEPDDNQTVEHFRLSGVDCNPPTNSHVLVIQAGGFLIAASVDDEIEQQAAEGEIEIYASASGSKTAKVKCEVGGTVKINNGSRSAAGENHSITIDETTDPAFVAWITAVSAALGITYPLSPPEVAGKISEGSATVKVP